MSVPEDVICHLLMNEYLDLHHRRLQTTICRLDASGTGIKHYKVERAHFASLCLVAKVFCWIAQPLLHRVFDDRGGFEEAHRSELFLRTLLYRPDLAVQVRQISFDLSSLSPAERGPKGNSLTPLFQRLEEDAYSSIMTDAHLSLSDVFPVRSETKHSVILTLCQNLDSLQFSCATGDQYDCHWLLDRMQTSWNETEKERYIPKAVAAPIGLGPAQQLRDIRYVGNFGFDNLSSPPATLYETCFQLHLLTFLCLERVALYAWTYTVSREFSTNLGEIHLHNSSWEIDAIDVLMSQSPRLRVLEMSSASPVVRDGVEIYEDIEIYEEDPCSLNFRSLGRVLCKRGTSLVKLTIDTRQALYYNTNAVEGDYIPLLGSLKALVCLRSLTVPLIQLLDLPDPDSFFSLNGTSNDHRQLKETLADQLAHEILPRSIQRVMLLDHRSRSSDLNVLFEFPGHS